jgi:hypothetical protein
VRVTVFLSFVPFPIPEQRIKDSRANNLQVEINRASAIGPFRAGILAAQPSQKRDAQFPNTKQAIVRVSHELHRSNFIMSNLRLDLIHGTRHAVEGWYQTN